MKNKLISVIMQAARATHIPEGWAGGWFIHKTELKDTILATHRGRLRSLPSGIYTALFRLTDSTMMNYPPGECVMEDTPFELRTHLQFMLKARGQVLVTGLGLGCVVRGLLANPAVDHVTCIEKSSNVLKLVQPHMPTERLTIIQADALDWTKQNQKRFDFAWHDLWTNRDEGEPILDIWHAQVIAQCLDTVEAQGAWNLDRTSKRFLLSRNVKLIA